MPIPLIVPLIGMAASAGISAYGQSQSAKANEQVNNYLQSRINTLTNKYNNDYYKDFMDSEVARSTMSRLGSEYKEMAKNITSSAAAGTTAEAEIAQKDNLQKRFGEAMNNLAGMGTEYKLNLKQQYDNNMMNLEGQKMSLLQQQAQKWNNLGQNAAGAANGLWSAYSMQ